VFDVQRDYYIALVTLSERRQRVQAYRRRGVPLTIALTRFTFGFHILLLRLCEWDTLIPKPTPLPQISHFAIFCTSFSYKRSTFVFYQISIRIASFFSESPIPA